MTASSISWGTPCTCFLLHLRCLSIRDSKSIISEITAGCVVGHPGCSSPGRCGLDCGSVKLHNFQAAQGRAARLHVCTITSLVD
jgi:hypothetical protein